MGTNIKGPWAKETHLEKHRRWHDNLIQLLSDMDDVIKDSPYSRGPDGKLLWSDIPVNLLIQFTAMNAMKLTHNHKDNNEVPV